jgi:phosphopantetheinyl transferase
MSAAGELAVDADGALLQIKRDDSAVRAAIDFTSAATDAACHCDPVSLLTAAEQNYWRTLTAERRQRSFLLGRLAAKRAISRASGDMDPDAVTIDRGVFTQPVVLGPAAAAGWDVSISHTDSVAVAIAFPRQHPMAIDIETAAGERIDAVASQLTESERAAAAAMDCGEARGMLLQWTMKEALSKVLGCGMMVPFALLETNDLSAATDRWRAVFRHFAQYQACGWVAGNTALSLVLPRNSSLISSPAALLAAARRVADPNATGAPENG